MKQILEEYESTPEAVKGEGTGAELVRIIRKIKQVERRLAEIEHEIEEISGSEMAHLKTKAEEYENQGRDLLAEIVVAIRKQIATAQKQHRSASV